MFSNYPIYGAELVNLWWQAGEFLVKGLAGDSLGGTGGPLNCNGEPESVLERAGACGSHPPEGGLFRIDTKTEVKIEGGASKHSACHAFHPPSGPTTSPIRELVGNWWG